jgi:hypothetical protein
MGLNHKWTDLRYLLDGSTVQCKVYDILDKYRVMQTLEPYHPILVGTVPIGIHVENSDLDIICEVHDFTRFEALVAANFHQYPGYSQIRRQVDGVWRTKVNFLLENWPVEIFGQERTSVEQNGFRHMVIENRMLSLYGEEFRQRIIDLKHEGLKTEPAFANLLKLEGDPFAKLLELESWNDEELLALWVG